uniref:Uncharacterized protein n=1 Tax=Lutzomyia longipalpis TaxID=7200 RepID=A0A1B0GL66_LUTLO
MGKPRTMLVRKRLICSQRNNSSAAGEVDGVAVALVDGEVVVAMRGAVGAAAVGEVEAGEVTMAVAGEADILAAMITGAKFIS